MVERNVTFWRLHRLNLQPTVNKMFVCVFSHREEETANVSKQWGMCRPPTEILGQEPKDSGRVEATDLSREETQGHHRGGLKVHIHFTISDRVCYSPGY